MSIADAAQLIIAFGTVVAAFTSVYAVIKIKEVKHLTNSLTDRLVELTRVESYAAGMKAEKDRIK